MKKIIILMLLLWGMQKSVRAIEPPNEAVNEPAEVGYEFLEKYCVLVRSKKTESEFIRLEINRISGRNCRKFDEVEELSFSINNGSDINDVVFLESILKDLRNNIVVEKYFSVNYQARIGVKINRKKFSASGGRFYIEIRSVN
jgi:hypothetical protein